MDTISIEKMSEFPCVGVSGKDNFKADWEKYFTKFDKIYLCLDSDGSSEESTLKIATILGKHRCHIVTLPNKDANELLVAHGDKAAAIFTEALRNATPLAEKCLLGTRSFIEKAIASYTSPQSQAISTGHYELDLMFGGFRKAELTVLTAYPGSGKTTLALSIANHVASQGYKVGLALFENNPLSETLPLIAGLHHKENPFEPRLAPVDIDFFLNSFTTLIIIPRKFRQ
jgi:twinkle protein